MFIAVYTLCDKRLRHGGSGYETIWYPQLQHVWVRVTTLIWHWQEKNAFILSFPQEWNYLIAPLLLNSDNGSSEDLYSFWTDTISYIHCYPQAATQLLSAARDGDLLNVKCVLAGGSVDVNVTDEVGSVPCLMTFVYLDQCQSGLGVERSVA